MEARRRSVFSLSRQDGQRRHKPDYMLIVLSVVLVLIGLVVVYAISPGLSAQKNVGENYFVSKQLIAIGMGVATFVFASFVSLNFWRKIDRPLLIAAGLASFAVLIFGQEVLGAKRWIQIGGLSFQAAELIKFAVLVWGANFLSRAAQRGEDLGDWHKSVKPLMIVIAVTSIVVAGLQSDLGSAVVIIAILTAMSFVAGMPLKRVAIIAAVIAAGVVLAVASTPYRRSRITAFINPEQDCLNTGYQACNSFLAIGSGGMFGKGINRGVSAYGYVPEAANDSIFAIYSEMFGFVGAVGLITLFVFLFSRIKRIALRTQDTYIQLLITGVLAWLSVQTFINIGAMIGLLPVKGITLPFVSYGGTSIIFVTAVIGLAFRASKYTALAPLDDKKGDVNESTNMRGRQRRPHYAQYSRR